ncbi:MAG: GNAT family N-acetyltransferase [Chitinophagales bacterium]|nr:GNAT family N-acetyltransferase [Chitinophagales bacterium]
MQEDIRVKNFDELSVEELYDIMHLRQEVFVVEQDCPYLDADYKDQKSIHVSWYKDGVLAAYTRIVRPGVSYKEASFGRVVSKPQWRRKGLGRPLINKCIEVLESQLNTRVCRISAQSYLLPFYEEFGFEICSEEYLEDGLPHKEMLRK